MLCLGGPQPPGHVSVWPVRNQAAQQEVSSGEPANQPLVSKRLGTTALTPPQNGTYKSHTITLFMQQNSFWTEKWKTIVYLAFTFSLKIHNTHPNKKSLKLPNDMYVCVLTIYPILIQTIFNSTM